MPASTEGLKTPKVRSRMPKTSATTKVLRMPSVRLLMPSDTSTTTPTTNRVPGVLRKGPGSIDLRGGALLLGLDRRPGCRRGTRP